MLKAVLFSDRMLQVGPCQTTRMLPNAVHWSLHRLPLPKLDAQGIPFAASPSNLSLDEADR